MERIREWAAAAMPPIINLAFYFLTVVLGNLLYASSLGHWLMTADGLPGDALYFDTTFTAGYWVLLLMPFVVIPIGVLLLRPLLQRFVVGPIVRWVPDFRPLDFAVILVIVLGIVAYALWRTDAFALVGNAINAQQAIEARFTLQGRMSFLEKVAIHSLLPFLSFYAVAATIKTQERFWLFMALISVGSSCVALVAINMKWPILVFYIGIVAGIFMFTQRWPYTKAAIGGVGLIVFYVVISTYVFRWVPVNEDRPQVSMAEASSESLSSPDRTDKPASPSLDYTELASSSVNATPFLVIHALNRMAISYPYYYKVFTEEGPVCGTLVQTYLPGKKPCAPTYLVYSRMFPADGYTGRGSAPAAPQVTAYAQQGWVGAVVAILFITIVLAAFSAIPLTAGPMAAAFAIVGATVGYHYSQLPLEGPIIYDHGFLWPLLLTMAYAILRHLPILSGRSIRDAFEKTQG